MDNNSKILNIISSIKEKDSFSVKLSDAILEKLSLVYPDSKVITRNLNKTPFSHLEEAELASFYTPADSRTFEQKEVIKSSDEAVEELMQADIIVIGVPIYNFGIPSTLKAWIDHIVRAGVTFKYSNGSPEGLIVNKKVFLAIASGAVFSEGPMQDYDFVESYLRATLSFIGLKDITVFRVEGTAIPELKELALPKALAAVEEFAY